MQNKKLKTASIVALSLVAFSLIFTFLLLLFGVYGDSIKSFESPGGDSSENLGASIGYGCSVAVHAVAVVFALLVKLVSCIIAFSSCFARKKKASIVTAAVFTCIIAGVSIFCGILVLCGYPAIVGTGINVLLVWGALILAPLTDLLWLAVAISRAVILSKNAKIASQSNVQLEDEKVNGEQNADGAIDSAIDSSVGGVTDGDQNGDK